MSSECKDERVFYSARDDAQSFRSWPWHIPYEFISSIINAMAWPWVNGFGFCIGFNAEG